MATREMSPPPRFAIGDIAYRVKFNAKSKTCDHCHNRFLHRHFHVETVAIQNMRGSWMLHGDRKTFVLFDITYNVATPPHIRPEMSLGVAPETTLHDTEVEAKKEADRRQGEFDANPV